MNTDVSDMWTPKSVFNKSKNMGSKIDATLTNSMISPFERVYNPRLDYSTDPSVQIMKELRRNRDKFVDTIFRAGIASLVNSLKNNKKPEWKQLEWLRLPELYRQFKITLVDEITPLSIKPGKFDSHGLLSVLAALSEFPDLIKKLFQVICHLFAVSN